MKKMLSFLLFATFSIFMGCSSNSEAPSGNSLAEPAKVTPQNWRPDPANKKQMDSLRQKAMATKNQKTDLSAMSNENITHSANSYADLYCRCQHLPEEAKQPISKNPEIEKPKFIETKPICLVSVKRSIQRISEGLKDVAKQKLFLDTYNTSIKSCK